MPFLDYNSSTSDNCSRFISDYHILMDFPFPIIINPMTWTYPMPTHALMDDNGTYVQTIRLSAEIHVPFSVFCLKRLQSLTIFRTPFLNGKLIFIAQKSKRSYSKLRYRSWHSKPTGQTQYIGHSWYSNHSNDR